MNLATVAVFGGSGKIGTRVIEVLQQQGKQIRALVHHMPLSYLDKRPSLASSNTEFGDGSLSGILKSAVLP